MEQVANRYKRQFDKSAYIESRRANGRIARAGSWGKLLECSVTCGQFAMRVGYCECGFIILFASIQLPCLDQGTLSGLLNSALRKAEASIRCRTGRFAIAHDSCAFERNTEKKAPGFREPIQMTQEVLDSRRWYRPCCCSFRWLRHRGTRGRTVLSGSSRRWCCPGCRVHG